MLSAATAFGKTDIAGNMMFYVKNSVKFTYGYGDIDERFYSFMELVFEDALKFIQKYNLQDG